MPARLRITMVCFHIAAALAVCAILPVALAMWFSDQGVSVWTLPAVPLVCVAFAVTAELTVRGLRQRQHKAWVTAIVLSCLMVAFYSALAGLGVVLGGLALWGLVDPETVAAFRTQNPGWDEANKEIDCGS